LLQKMKTHFSNVLEDPVYDRYVRKNSQYTTASNESTQYVKKALRRKLNKS
jgi:hypothetical protein